MREELEDEDEDEGVEDDEESGNEGSASTSEEQNAARQTERESRKKRGRDSGTLGAADERWSRKRKDATAEDGRGRAASGRDNKRYGCDRDETDDDDDDDDDVVLDEEVDSLEDQGEEKRARRGERRNGKKQRVRRCDDDDDDGDCGDSLRVGNNARANKGRRGEKKRKGEGGRRQGRGGEEGYPLPGYGKTPCRLCTLFPGDGSRVVDILKEATRKYHEFASPQRQRVLSEVFTARLKTAASEESQLSHLLDVSVQEVTRHMAGDHDRLRDEVCDPKKAFKHALVTALYVQSKTLCEKVEKGKHKGEPVVSPGKFDLFLRGVQIFCRHFDSGVDAASDRPRDDRP